MMAFANKVHVVLNHMHKTAIIISDGHGRSKGGAVSSPLDDQVGESVADSRFSQAFAKEERPPEVIQVAILPQSTGAVFSERKPTPRPEASHISHHEAVKFPACSFPGLFL